VGVAVGRTGVDVGGIGVAVGGTAVAVGGRSVAVIGTGVAVGGTGGDQSSIVFARLVSGHIVGHLLHCHAAYGDAQGATKDVRTHGHAGRPPLRPLLLRLAGHCALDADRRIGAAQAPA
jgi:hypothetical protein